MFAEIPLAECDEIGLPKIDLAPVWKEVGDTEAGKNDGERDPIRKTGLLNINYRSIPVADIPIVSRLAVIKIGHIEEILQNGWQFDPIGQLFFNREITSINHMMLYTKWSDLL